MLYRLLAYALAACALPLASCLYIPPVSDIRDPINNIDGIQVGQTTRSEVLALLGDTPSVCSGSSPQTAQWYHYNGTSSAGQLAFYSGDRKSLGETPWYLNLYFHQNDVVEAVDTNPPPSSGQQVNGVPFEEFVKDLKRRGKL
jgi:outer membrane protein assembly factor BamE (lipoprotein component of BamABCDE complex)